LLYAITGYNQTLVMADEASKRAPGELETVRELINTLDIEDDEDQLDSAWLERSGLATGAVSDTDVECARQLREAMRDLLDHHVPGPTERLNRIAAEAPLTVSFDEHGHARLQPAGAGFAAIAARVLAIVERAQADGTWERLKACAAGTCRWAFYDQSRNRSRQWCDMAVCGNRAKARSYRKRTT
jgi:predicted RNA-binding Zn ribbon-like protein